MSFGENLKRIREKSNITQEQLAHAIGLKTKAAISKIEKNITDPNQSTITKLANALSVSPLEFFDFYWKEVEEKRLEPFKEYLPFLAQADDVTLKNIRAILGMPMENKKSEPGDCTRTASC